jgi:hypothetical protein
MKPSPTYPQSLFYEEMRRSKICVTFHPEINRTIQKQLFVEYYFQQSQHDFCDTFRSDNFSSRQMNFGKKGL